LATEIGTITLPYGEKTDRQTDGKNCDSNSGLVRRALKLDDKTDLLTGW